MSKKIYVGNISFQATEEQVNELFAEFGEIKSFAWVTDRETGRFRGFCFIEMEQAEADAAIAALDGKDLVGRPLRVNEAKPREDRFGGGRRGGGGGRFGGGGGGNRGGGGGRGGNRRNDDRRRDDFRDSGGGSYW